MEAYFEVLQLYTYHRRSVFTDYSSYTRKSLSKEPISENQIMLIIKSEDKPKKESSSIKYSVIKNIMPKDDKANFKEIIIKALKMYYNIREGIILIRVSNTNNGLNYN